MAWTDQLQRATFRGIPFYHDEAGMDGGRRTVKHEYPLRDQPYVEDMGRAGRTFTLEGYVLGPTYYLERDALISALEQGGNGTLVHPYLGSKQVKCSSFSYRERSKEGRYASFSMTFEESSEAPTFPGAGLDNLGLVNQAADNALLALATNFLGIYDVGLQPQFSIDSLVGIIRDGASLLESLFGNRTTDVQTQAAVSDTITRLFDSAPVIVRSPTGIVEGIQGTIGMVASALAPADATAVMQGAHGLFSGSDPAVLTATRQKEVVNREAIFSLFRGSAAVEAGRAAIQVDYASYNEAVDTRNSITTMLDDEAAKIDDSTTYLEIDRVRKELVRGLPAENKSLPRIAAFTLNETTPSLVVSHYIYGDIANEADIVARNKVRHPGFVVGNRQLEVLTQ